MSVDCLTKSLVPLKPFTLPVGEDDSGGGISSQPTVEVAELQGATERDVHPYASFAHHLYVYPLSLNFESQKFFARARNLAVCVELHETDVAGARAMPVSPHFVGWFAVAILTTAVRPFRSAFTAGRPIDTCTWCVA